MEIPEAEREASEVLHSLLPVERIERRDENETITKPEENNSNASEDWEHVSLNHRKATAQINVVIRFSFRNPKLTETCNGHSIGYLYTKILGNKMSR